MDQVRAVHGRVRGTTAEGEAYAAADPHLLGRVHTAEVDSFLRAHRRYGRPAAGRRGDTTGTSPTPRGWPPRSACRTRRATRPSWRSAWPPGRLAAYRAELRSTPQARDAARLMLPHPPLPWPARAPYGVLGACAVALLPPWARAPLRLPYLPVVERTGIRLAGDGLTRVSRWAMTPPPGARPEGPRRTA